MTGLLTGKVAFITGAARGQGRAHAVRMANEGADIIAIDIAGKLPDCVPYDPATPDDLAETPEDFRDVMDINVTGTWNTVMAGAQKIIDGDRGGSIILISSAAGIKMQPFMIHYTASKHAVTGMARAFAAELGRYSIRVNSVHPGAVNTLMGSGDMIGSLGRAIETYPQLAQMITPFLPTWAAEPEDIADAVCWLASEEAKKRYGCRDLDRPGNDAVLICAGQLPLCGFVRDTPGTRPNPHSHHVLGQPRLMRAAPTRSRKTRGLLWNSPLVSLTSIQPSSGSMAYRSTSHVRCFGSVQWWAPSKSTPTSHSAQPMSMRAITWPYLSSTGICV
jgi:NAD(P)-dependent dehydrogenase (short-subunit alcohol dehydrogenase family)